MSEHAPDRQWFGIDIVKLVAGTLAAISAAVVGSFLGVAGTLGGAAVASIVGGIGTELYAKSLKHGVSRLQKQQQQVQPPVTAPAALGTPAVATSSHQDEKPGHFDSVPQAGAGKSGWSRWRLIAIPAVAFFVLAMGAVSMVEGFAGNSIAGMFGDESAGSSTLRTAVKKVSSTEKDPPEQDKTPTDDPSGGSKGTTGKPAGNVSPAPGTTTPPDGGTAPTGTTAPEPTAETDPGNTGGTGDGTGTGDSTGGGTGSQLDSGDSVEQGGTGGQEGLTGQRAPDQTPRQAPQQPAETQPAE